MSQGGGTTLSVTRERPRLRPRDPGTDRRLAAVHLRMGLFGLARAELEALAGSADLDQRGLLLLAEARWRTGDVTGAGEAAQAYLATGGEDVVGLVIAAEAMAAIGRPSEARRLVSRVQERVDVQLDRIFAGIRPSAVWPDAPGVADSLAETRPWPAPSRGTTAADVAKGGEPASTSAARSTPRTPSSGFRDPRAVGGVAEPAPPSEPAPPAEPAISETALRAEPAIRSEPATRGEPAIPETALRAEPAIPETAPVVEPAPPAQLATARSDLAAGNQRAAALRFGVALRIDRALAGDVLEAIEAGEASSAELELVRGDALRLLGREDDARRAYAAASELIRRPPHAIEPGKGDAGADLPGPKRLGDRADTEADTEEEP